MSKRITVGVYALAFKRFVPKYPMSSVLTNVMRLANLLFNQRGDENNKYTHLMLSIDDDLIDVPLDPTLKVETVFFGAGKTLDVIEYIVAKYPTVVDVCAIDFKIDYAVVFAALYGVLPTDYSDFVQWLWNRFRGQWESQVNVCTLPTLYLMRTILGFKGFKFTDTIPEILTKLERLKRDGKIAW